MKTPNDQLSKTHDKGKTAPAGMAPDKAHATRSSSHQKGSTDQDETFESSPMNSGRQPNPKLK